MVNGNGSETDAVRVSTQLPIGLVTIEGDGEGGLVVEIEIAGTIVIPVSARACRIGTDDGSVQLVANPLTARQTEILGMLERPNKEIAIALNITAQTVKNQVTVILAALDVRNRTQALATAIELGWISPKERAARVESEPGERPTENPRDFLLRMMAGGPLNPETSDIYRLAAAVNISRGALKTARQRLGIVATHIGGHTWEWTMPEGQA